MVIIWHLPPLCRKSIHILPELPTGPVAAVDLSRVQRRCIWGGALAPGDQFLKTSNRTILLPLHNVFPTQHCDTSMPPPPIPPPAPSQPQQQQAAPPSPLSCCAEDKPLTFDSARLNARRKERYIILTLMSSQNAMFFPG